MMKGLLSSNALVKQLVDGCEIMEVGVRARRDWQALLIDDLLLKLGGTLALETTPNTEALLIKLPFGPPRI